VTFSGAASAAIVANELQEIIGIVVGVTGFAGNSFTLV
jgi:hypothetical protein